MALLIFNAGSSSLKVGLIDPDDLRVWNQETIEVGPGANGDEGASDLRGIIVRVSRSAGALARTEPAAAITGVVHRVVHGGTRFTDPTRITPEVRQALSELNVLAPLHNPPSLRVIDAALDVMPDRTHVAVFDTAFHKTLVPESRTYPLPHEWSERWGLRRFGFHGLSHAYCAARSAELMGRPAAGLRLVTAHLGNGASVTAVRDGRSVDTSMGFTPLEGLMMGTRSGSIDPGLLLYLQKTCGVGVDDLDRALNHESGLLGVSGLSSDMRALMKAADAGNAQASLAVRMFAHRARQAIGALAVTLGGADALVFTGGIGEHSPQVRAAICDGLSALGFELDEIANRSARPDCVVSTPDSPGRIFVLTAREDVEMARAAMSCLEPSGVRHAAS